jgi:hypothetical protein
VFFVEGREIVVIPCVYRADGDEQSPDLQCQQSGLEDRHAEPGAVHGIACSSYRVAWGVIPRALLLGTRCHLLSHGSCHRSDSPTRRFRFPSHSVCPGKPFLFVRLILNGLEHPLIGTLKLGAQGACRWPFREVSTGILCLRQAARRSSVVMPRPLDGSVAAATREPD